MMMIYLTSPSFVLDLKPLEVGLRFVRLHESLSKHQKRRQQEDFWATSVTRKTEEEVAM